MMPSTEQPRWFNHHPHHPGITGNPHPGDPTSAAAFCTPSGATTPHHPAITPYMDPGYMEDMDAYLHHHMDAPSTAYYGINMPYAAHQRRLNGKLSARMHQYM